VYVYRAQRQRVEELASTGPSTGCFAEAAFDTVELGLEPGDVLLLYTDGLIEATAAGNGEMFGAERVRNLLEAHGKASPQRILGALREALERFTGRHAQEDDVSISVIKAAAVTAASTG
jgi:sigma-B regulation protein RsbU (phosphoserine phosphatase)